MEHPEYDALVDHVAMILTKLPEREAVAYLIHRWDQTFVGTRDRLACLALADDILRAQSVYRAAGVLPE